jgi:phosphoribosylformylglycinamidine cyclo-ligase
MIKGIAHITGGGLVDNLPRILPANCDAVIETKSWKTPAIFQILQQHGDINPEEMYQVFNMGIGMVAIVAAGRADAVLRAIRAAKHDAWHIGEVVKGKGVVKVV